MAAVSAGRPPPWRDVRVLRATGQIVFVVVVVVVAREIWLNLTFNYRRFGIDSSFDFLNSRAGFGIKEGIDYSPNQPYRKAFFVGIVNTLRVAVPGIVLASLLGLVIGVARLSTNWLIRKIGQVFVETLRNIPVLVVIAFVYVGVILPLPPIGGGFHIPGLMFLSNRGLAATWPRVDEGFGPWAAFLAVGLLVAWAVWRWRTRVSDRTGEPHHRVAYALPVLLAVAAVGFVLTGGPIRLDVPEVGARGFGYDGGLQLSPELSALLIALVLYTAAFIAEVVRGSIQAVSKGQKEAAEALGFTPFQQLRFVVLPQALRIAIPPLNSQYLNLLKNSSLAVFIGYPDLANVSKTIINQSARSYQTVAILMASYLFMTLTISFLMNLLNRAVTVKGERR